MKKRYLLIDSENIQNRMFEIIGTARKKDRIIIFYTLNHSGKLDDYLKTDQKRRENIEFVQCISGNNALDLQLLGVLSYLIQRHPDREYIIYSNDKGYRPAVKHWQGRNIEVEQISFLTPDIGYNSFEFRSTITADYFEKAKKLKKKNTDKNNTEKNKNIQKTVSQKNQPVAKPQVKTTNAPKQDAPQLTKPEKEMNQNSAAPSSQQQSANKATVITEQEKIQQNVIISQTENETPAKSSAVIVDAILRRSPRKEKLAASGTPAVNNVWAKPEEKNVSEEQNNEPDNIAPSNEEEQTITKAKNKNPEKEFTNEDFIRGMCSFVKLTDLPMVNRVLSMGFGTDGAKDSYARLKNDEQFRCEMNSLYLQDKSERLLSLFRTVLSFNQLDPSSAEIICSILEEKSTKNMQSVYHSFIKRMPGNVIDRQNIYKAVKPYLAIVESI